jgi:hypothetical protein
MASSSDQGISDLILLWLKLELVDPAGYNTLPLSITLSLGLLKLISSIVLRGKAKLDFPTRII